MPIELRQIRYFALLADELNFGRAAKRANISQSSMTEQIQRLEDILGVRVAERDRRGVRLTAAGERLVRHLPNLLKSVEEMLVDVRSKQAECAERLYIGHSEMAITSQMPRMVQRFREIYPSTEIILKEQSSAGCVEALLARKFDCLFVPDPPRHDSIASLVLHHEPVMVCIPEASNLAQNEFVDCHDLKGVPLILAEERSRFGIHIRRVFKKGGVTPLIVALSNRASATITFSAAASGVGFLPASMRALASPGIVLRPFGNPEVTIPFSLAWFQNMESPAVKHFVALAESYASLKA